MFFRADSLSEILGRLQPGVGLLAYTELSELFFSPWYMGIIAGTSRGVPPVELKECCIYIVLTTGLTIFTATSYSRAWSFQASRFWLIAVFAAAGC